MDGSTNLSRALKRGNGSVCYFSSGPISWLPRTVQSCWDHVWLQLPMADTDSISGTYTAAAVSGTGTQPPPIRLQVVHCAFSLHVCPGVALVLNQRMCLFLGYTSGTRRRAERKAGRWIRDGPNEITSTLKTEARNGNTNLESTT